jgi:ABC-2 type transport system permease protein
MTAAGASRLVHQLRFDLRAFGRDRQARLATLVLPAVLLVVLVGVSRGERVAVPGHDVSIAQYLAPGLAVLGIASAAFATLVTDVVAQREAGVLKRRRSHPVAAWVLVASRSLTAVAVSLAVTVALLLVAGNAYDVTIPDAGLPALAITVVAGALALSTLGYALSTAVRTPGAAQAAVQVVLLPAYVISGILVPSTKLPEWLDAIARAFPFEHLAAAMRHAVDPAASGSRLAPGDLAVLALWSAAAFVVAFRRFRWLPAGG